MSNTEKSIYIVDDDKIFLLITTRLLKKMYPQAEIKTFEGGEKAIESIRKKIPQLLFLDLNMPGMDGWQFLDTIESSGDIISFPIYVSTSSINPLDKEKSELHDMVKGFIEKPWKKEDISKIVESL